MMSTKQRRSLAPAVNTDLNWGHNTGTTEPSAPGAPSRPAAAGVGALEETKVRKVRKVRVRRDSFSTRVEEHMLNTFYEYTNDEGVSVVDATDEAISDFLKKKGLL